MQNEAETVYELLKTELGFSMNEADRYLIITEIYQAVVVRMRNFSWLEPKTWNAFLALMQKLGAVHNEESPVFAIGTVSSHKEPKTEEKASYSLASSKEGLGELVPVLVDKFGNIIDGFHRKGENANWREEVLPWIDTPEKLEAARLAVNFDRRQMTPEEIKERVTFLIGKGMRSEEISKLTGISKTTIYKYMPQDAKNPKKVEAGKASGEARQNFVPLAEQDKRKVSEEQLTGSYLDLYSECSGCHLMLYKAHLINGKCELCREGETKQKTSVDAALPVDVAEIRKALGQPEAPLKENQQENMPGTIQNMLSLKETLEEEIIFLINLPSTISLSKEKLEEFFTSRDYDETGLTKRQVAQTPAGLTVTFDLQQWNNSNIEDGAPLGVKHSSIFRDELISILEGEPTCNIDELEKITIQQLHPTDPEPEPEPEQKKPKAVKEIDWNAQGVSCPCCGCTISQEKYQRLKEKFSKYSGLFAE